MEWIANVVNARACTSVNRKQPSSDLSDGLERIFRWSSRGVHELVAAQSAEEGQRAPVTVRREAPHPGALRPPSAQRGHAGLDPCLVDEDQAAGIEAGLP
jgi:hypothetical protein